MVATAKSNSIFAPVVKLVKALGSELRDFVSSNLTWGTKFVEVSLEAATFNE